METKIFNPSEKILKRERAWSYSKNWRYIFNKEWDCDILLKNGDRINSGFNHYEAGVNRNGCIDAAKKLIDVAARSGAIL